MNRTACTILLCACLSEPALRIHSAEFKFGDQTLTVPDGFVVERVAGPPAVDRPITADFDEEGRLYVTDSSGTNDKADKQLQDKPHRVLRLIDANGDGRFDQSAVFADKLMFPEGCLWYRGSLYVSAPPSIWKLTDTDGDGVADRREEWLPAKTLTGCANDLHGPFLGPDGWIYWCKGAFAKQTYELPNGKPFVTRASHIFRARLDGSGIEPVLTGGMDNPVSVAFTSGGERILTGTFFVHPGGGQRDGLIHAIYGGVYGKDHDVLEGHPRTGELMPIMTHHGPSASSFVLRYESGAFGEKYRDSLFACLFNLHKVTRHTLVPDGATYKTQDEDFLVSDNPDFHPTDLIEDADGSLLVVDTGGWYKLCCPTSQLWKPDVLGAIYRVKKTGAPTLKDPRGRTIPWASLDANALAALLGDERLAVRQRAIDQLALRKEDSVPVLHKTVAKAATAQARLNAVWALTRIDGESARTAARIGLTDADETVRQAAIHSASVRLDRGAQSQLLSLLRSGSSPLQRASAEALGRFGDKAAVPELLQVAADRPDRVLEHSAIYALIEIADADAVRREATNDSASAFRRRAALIALDQMQGGGLQAEAVTPLLGSSDPVLKQTAAWIVSHHPEWAAALVGFFSERLALKNLSSEEQAEFARQLSGFARDEEVQRLLAASLQDSAASKDTRLMVLRAMAQSRLKQAPPPWCESIARVLDCKQVELVNGAVSTARALALPKDGCSELRDALRRVGMDKSGAPEARLEAMAAVPGGPGAIEPDTFEFLCANLDSARPVMTRSLAADVLAKAKLKEEQLNALADVIQRAGPLEVPKLLSAYERTTSDAVGLKLLASLKGSPGLSGLRPETVTSHLTNFSASVQEAGAALAALLNVDAGKQKAHLDELAGGLAGGDIRRGQTVFNSQKTACATCHAIGYLGGNVGPDLTRIGQIRTERDLLEAIVYPSASFVRSFEPVVVVTRSGDDYSGVVRKDAPDELVLATGPGAEVRIARSDIQEMRPGSVSVMPGGLDEQLSRQELADLVAFLRATRW